MRARAARVREIAGVIRSVDTSFPTDNGINTSVFYLSICLSSPLPLPRARSLARVLLISARARSLAVGALMGRRFARIRLRGKRGSVFFLAAPCCMRLFCPRDAPPPR